jgi:hypothetical protein
MATCGRRVDAAGRPGSVCLMSTAPSAVNLFSEGRIWSRQPAQGDQNDGDRLSTKPSALFSPLTSPSCPYLHAMTICRANAGPAAVAPPAPPRRCRQQAGSHCRAPRVAIQPVQHAGELQQSSQRPAAAGEGWRCGAGGIRRLQLPPEGKSLPSPSF